MRNQELLELAAYAVNFKIVKYVDDVVGLIIQNDDGTTMSWNPLVDDQDAFRLMVSLVLNVKFTSCADDAPIVKVTGLDENCPVIIPNFPCPYTASRKAIVLAAAETAKLLMDIREWSPETDDEQ